MPQERADRPYIQAWLKRVGRQLRGSGRLSQVALALSRSRGGRVEDWSSRLRDLLEGDDLPDPEFITAIDRLLSVRIATRDSPQSTQTLLF